MFKSRHVKIGQHRIGPRQPCFVIAEVGVNHNGDLATALQMVDVAAEAGADAVKFQSFVADELVTAYAPKASYQGDNTESQRAMLRRLQLAPDEHRHLMSHCQKKKIDFLSTPFERTSANLLESLNVAAFKVGSGEITDLPFLAFIAGKQKPLILSTGTATLAEVSAAVRLIRKARNPSLILLHCVSNYPTDPRDVNLRAIDTLSSKFRIPVGFSDHTRGIEIAVAAVARGACVIEKHFTLKKTMPGPDHAFSLEPDELKKMITAIRNVEASLGDGHKSPAPGEQQIAEIVRKSCVAKRDILLGEILKEDMLTCQRPGTGLPPSFLPKLIGKRARAPIPGGTMIEPRMVR
jgi:N,N'-diacetyllegionaminate synthase